MRLIDADDFKKFMQALCKAGSPYESFIELLDKQTTAYDIDKVVEELEKESFTTTDTVCGGIFKAIRTISAIEIVKKSVVSYDVCEWKKSKDYPFDWLVGCDGCEVNHRQGDYCPRCGKKIKVV